MTSLWVKIPVGARGIQTHLGGGKKELKLRAGMEKKVMRRHITQNDKSVPIPGLLFLHRSDLKDNCAPRHCMYTRGNLPRC